MISRCINQVRLASDVADEFFPNIKGDIYREDVSWLATMRAMLPSRISSDQKVQLHLLDKISLSSRSREETVKHLLAEVDCVTPYTITVINTQASAADREKISSAVRHIGIQGHEFMDAIYQRFHGEKEHPGYVLIFVNHETANTVIVTFSLTIMLWHSLQGFMRTYFKKAFEEHPITEDEMNLLRALVNVNGYNAYMELVKKFEESYDFRSAIIRKSLANFTLQARTKSIKNTESIIADANRIIKNAQENISKQIARRNDAQEKLYGLKFAAEEDKTAEELTDYFLNNTRLIFTEQGGNHIDYWVKGELCYFDEQCAESYIRTTRGYMYEGCDHYGIDKHDFQKVLKAIFIDRTAKVEMCAAYRFIFDDEDVGIHINSNAVMPAELVEYLKNPHSMYNSCWGTHENNLYDALSSGDYPGAVAVTIAATCELNISDVSTATFSRWLCSSEQKCLRLPDGSHVTCQEYIDMLKEEADK